MRAGTTGRGWAHAGAVSTALTALTALTAVMAVTALTVLLAAAGAQAQQTLTVAAFPAVDEIVRAARV